MTDVAVAMLDDQRLIRDGEVAVDLYNKEIKNARAQIMPMARGLLAAKRKYPATQDFGDWLQTSSYREIDSVERAALIKIGEHEPFAEKFVCTTSLVSPRTIWDVVRDMLSSLHHVNSTDQDTPSVETNPEPSTTPVSLVPTFQEVTKTAAPPAVEPRYQLAGSSSDRGKPLKNVKSVALVKLLDLQPEQYATVMGAYQHNRQVVLKSEFGHLAKNKKIAKKTLYALFDRAHNVVKAGKAPNLSNSQAFDARVFLPDVPEAFAKPIDILKLAQRIDRLDLLNNKAAELIAAKVAPFEIHNELHHIWERGAVRPPQVAKIIELPADDSKNRVKHEVKYCGEIIWPHESLKHVTYADLNMGWHIADHWLKHLETATPKKPNELLIEIMHLVHDLRAASSLNGVTDVIMACVQAYAKRNQRASKADLSDGFPPGKPR